MAGGKRVEEEIGMKKGDVGCALMRESLVGTPGRNSNSKRNREPLRFIVEE